MSSVLASPIMSTSSSDSKPSPAKSVSFHIKEVDDRDEENDGERAMSSVESENGITSQSEPEPEGYVPRPSESVASEEEEGMRRPDASSGRRRLRSIGDTNPASGRIRSGGRRERDGIVYVGKWEKGDELFDGGGLSSLPEEGETQQEEEESPRGRTTSQRSPASSPSLDRGGPSQTNSLSPAAQRDSSSTRRQAVEVVVSSSRHPLNPQPNNPTNILHQTNLLRPRKLPKIYWRNLNASKAPGRAGLAKQTRGCPDVSMANAMEADELIASEGDGGVGMESIIDLTESSLPNQGGSSLLGQEFVDTIDPVVDPPSQSMGCYDVVQSQPQPQPQPQGRTHSPVEEPSSSRSIPPPGQPRRAADTISFSTPAIPSPAVLPTSEGVFPPSSAPLPASSAPFPRRSAILPPSQLVLPPNELFPSNRPALPSKLPGLSSNQPILPSSLAAPLVSALPATSSAGPAPSVDVIPWSSLQSISEPSTDAFQVRLGTQGPVLGSKLVQYLLDA
ncbi:hypothetical protein BDV93DRAFT_515832 [Ceratobasidium sp. AG-I]|nr:hypothetical protein BDV93DRAFT_515832 [Ceratobasidium sp. AG-I]